MPDLPHTGNYRHGHGVKGHESPTYISWKKMRERCNDPNNNRYKYYGALGIEVCERWQNSFANFLEDMGERPAGMTLDRKFSNLDYDKQNCRWATDTVQGRHGNAAISFNGKTQSITEWAAELGINRNTLANRLHRQWPVSRALSAGS